MPLDELLATDRNPHESDPGKVSVFYALSWALTHYIMAGDSSGETLPPETYREWKERFGCDIIDGRGVPSHGDCEMPVWGDVFRMAPAGATPGGVKLVSMPLFGISKESRSAACSSPC